MFFKKDANAPNIDESDTNCTTHEPEKTKQNTNKENWSKCNQTTKQKQEKCLGLLVFEMHKFRTTPNLHTDYADQKKNLHTQSDTLTHMFCGLTHACEPQNNIWVRRNCGVFRMEFLVLEGYLYEKRYTCSTINHT